MALGSRVFEPSWLMSAGTLLLLLAFLALGRWQWDRGVQKQATWAAFARGADAPRQLDAALQGFDSLPRFAHVRLSGHYDGLHQFLLDNRSFHGRAGYEVLTPLAVGGARTVLIDRGWVPFDGFRGRLPDVSLRAADQVTLSARVDEIGSGGLAAGHAAPGAGEWPRVTSFPTAAELAHALGRPVEPRLLLLDADAPLGYARDWQPPGVSPARHFSYAIQWWLFASLLVGLYLLLNLRRVGP